MRYNHYKSEKLSQIEVDLLQFGVATTNMGKYHKSVNNTRRSGRVSFIKTENHNHEI